MTSVLVQAILHEDKLVRVAAASVAFNVAAWVQRGRVARIQGGGNEPNSGGMREDEEDVEWEVELVSAIVEALEREKESEEVGQSFRVCVHIASPLTLDSCGNCSSPFVGDVGVTHPTVSGL